MYVALVGAGYWGKNHLRILYRLRALNTVCDKNESILRMINREYPELKITTEFNDVLKNPEIDAVFIASSAATHYALTKEVLLAGKDVFVEKPLALSVKEGEELVKLALQKNRILMVGHLLHYHPAIQLLKELVQRGELGELRYIASHRLNFGKIRSEENVLWSFAPHDISLILYFFGCLPDNVQVMEATYLQKNIPDTTVSYFHFPGNKKAHIFVSWLHPFKEQKFVVIGDKNMAVFDDQSKEKLVVYQNEVVWENNSPVAKKNGAIPLPISSREPLVAEIEHFLECVKMRKTPITDGEEGLRVLKVLETCQSQMYNALT